MRIPLIRSAFKSSWDPYAAAHLNCVSDQMGILTTDRMLSLGNKLWSNNRYSMTVQTLVKRGPHYMCSYFAYNRTGCTIWTFICTVYRVFSINDGVKDTEQYFLLCHTYGANICYLFNRVNAILLPYGLINLSNEELLKIILYGHEQLSFDSNAKILTAILEYIKAS